MDPVRVYNCHWNWFILSPSNYVFVSSTLSNSAFLWLFLWDLETFVFPFDLHCLPCFALFTFFNQQFTLFSSAWPFTSTFKWTRSCSSFLHLMLSWSGHCKIWADWTSMSNNLLTSFSRKASCRTVSVSPSQIKTFPYSLTLSMSESPLHHCGDFAFTLQTASHTLESRTSPSQSSSSSSRTSSAASIHVRQVQWKCPSLTIFLWNKSTFRWQGRNYCKLWVTGDKSTPQIPKWPQWMFWKCPPCLKAFVTCQTYCCSWSYDDIHVAVWKFACYHISMVLSACNSLSPMHAVQNTTLSSYINMCMIFPSIGNSSKSWHTYNDGWYSVPQIVIQFASYTLVENTFIWSFSNY